MSNKASAQAEIMKAMGLFKGTSGLPERTPMGECVVSSSTGRLTPCKSVSSTLLPAMRMFSSQKLLVRDCLYPEQAAALLTLSCLVM